MFTKTISPGARKLTVLAVLLALILAASSLGEASSAGAIVSSSAARPTESQDAEELFEPEIPPLPLYLSIDSFGNISLTTGLLQQPRLLIRREAPSSPALFESLGESLLVLRFDGYDHIYDLGKQPAGVITFERGYYSASRLSRQGTALLLETARTFVRNDAPISGLENLAAAQVITGRRSCTESAFHSRMYGTVVHAVRLRKLPYIPKNLDHNWSGSLRNQEKVYILQTYCNAGSWLRLVDEAGNIGWAKEWGLTKALVERTFIIPLPSGH